jgi:prepilin signal peptidase PulO-like enzyme (type II secretory pathway)
MYPLGEAAIGLLYAAIFCCVYYSGLHLAAVLPFWWFAGSMLSAARIDAAHRIIPNKITYTGIIAALAMALIVPECRPSLAETENALRFGTIFTAPLMQKIAAAELPQAMRAAAAADVALGIIAGTIIPGIFALIGNAFCRRRAARTGAACAGTALGWGDVKLMAMTGALLGAEAVVFILAGGAMLGTIYGLLRMAADPAFRKKPSVPLAPFVAVPALLWCCAGNWIYCLIAIAR